MDIMGITNYKVGIISFSLLLIIIFSFVFFINFNKTVEFKNIEICDNFSNSKLRIICYSFFFANSTYCDFVGVFKQKCISFSNIKRANENFCNKIKIPLQKALCFSYLAIKEKDPSICEKLNSQSLKESCFLQIPAKYYNSYSEDYCNSMTHPSSKYTCLAIVKNNISYCNKILSYEPLEADLCKALMSKNSSFCKTEVCRQQMAYFENNIALCDLISSSLGKAECIGMVSKDTKKCDELKEGFGRDWCKLYALAYSYLDS